MPHPLFVKLGRFLHLTQAEQEYLVRLFSNQDTFAPKAQIVRAGEPVNGAYLVAEGWAVRSRTLPDGRRQILNFILPGDFCDPTTFVESNAVNSITAMTELRVTRINRQQVLDLVTHSPRLGAAFWWHETYESTMTRAHLVAVGRMNAFERIAYLLRELESRLQIISRVQGSTFHFPGTQSDLADALGLSNVHVSRTLRRLSLEGILKISGSGITILDTGRLASCAKLRTPIEYVGSPPDGLKRMLDDRRDTA